MPDPTGLAAFPQAVARLDTRPEFCQPWRVSFAVEFKSLPVEALLHRSLSCGANAVRESLAASHPTLADFAHLISPAASAPGVLEEMGRKSHALTLKRFGRVIRLFAPLYVSNECVNNCRYCGFSRENPILRVTLTPEDVMSEARAIREQGFRNLLLVAGEHPRFVSNSYLRDCIAALHPDWPSLSLEIGPMETGEYAPLVQAGAEGLVVYQETYNREVYAEMHPSGPKRDFEWRLGTPERAYAAGFRRLGIGALYGLSDWRREAICLAAHAQHLLRHCWKSYVTLSMPRLRPCAGSFQPLDIMSDRDMVQLVCAFRILFPDVGLVLSTREPEKLRNGLIPLGITLISAGSHTEPGGYTGAGRDQLHRTENGRIVELAGDAGERAAGKPAAATHQFQIADERSAEEMALQIRRMGYEPVWKDWDAAFTA
jgi:2-iminoacetate synthase